MQWEGFAYAAGAAVGHSCIDVSRKMAAQHYSPAELIAMVGLLDALLLSALVFVFGSDDKFGSLDAMLRNQDRNLLRILVVSSGLKVMAGYMYQRALQLSPISVTVPYLAFTPVLLVFTSYFLMNEMPSFRGLLGVVVVTVGGYLLVVERPGEKHAKIMRGNQRGLSLTSEEGSREVEMVESFNISLSTETKRTSLRSFLDWICSSHFFEPLLALRREQGSLLMLGVAGLFSISNSLDKMGTHLSPSSVLFATIQRLIMTIPVVIYLALVSPRSFKHLWHCFPAFAVISVFEVAAFLCYLKSLETLLVSYAIAAKRSNVLLSVLVGRVVFKEKIWRKLPFVMLMVGGMILIILA